MLGSDTRRDAWIYCLAAHEYYWGDGQQSILTDAEYDALTPILRMYWSDIPDELRILIVSPSNLGQGAVQIVLDEQQYAYAVEVYQQYRRDKDLNDDIPIL